jgi:long-chain fatty acid transport protein
MLSRKPMLLAAAAAGLLGPGAAHAGAFYLQEQSVRGLGRAYSGEAAGQGADALWWNPAAIARSPREVYLGAHGLLLSTEVDNAGSTITFPGGVTAPVGGDPRSYGPALNGIAPNAAFSTPIGDRFAVGLSLTAPFNFTSKYAADSWARYDTLKARVTTLDVQGTVAMQATDWLDLGVGVNAEYSSSRLSLAYPNLVPGAPDGRFTVSGDGWNYGWTVGGQAHFGDVHLGLSYRSAMDHDMDGDISLTGLVGPLAGANMHVSAGAQFKTPWIVNLGARWQATPQLALNVQAQRFGWSEFDYVRVRTPTGSQALPELYRDTTSVAVGADYAVTPAWTLRVGVAHDQTPSTDQVREAGIPDSDRWLYTVGTSVTVAPGVTVDGAFGYLGFEGGPIRSDMVFYGGTPAQTVAHTRGVAVGDAKIMSAGVRWRF